MTFNEKIVKLENTVRQIRAASSVIREGQAYFNALDTIDRPLANELRGTKLDPFYDDTKKDAFIEYVHNYWYSQGD